MLFSTAVVLFLVVAGPILSSESAQDRQAYAAWPKGPWQRRAVGRRHAIDLAHRILQRTLEGAGLSAETSNLPKAGFLSWSFTMLLAFAFLTLFVTIALFLWRASAWMVEPSSPLPLQFRGMQPFSCFPLSTGFRLSG